jgi:hypothetical protein
MEIWKEIPGSGGKYQISNYGNVYSLINNVQLKGVNNGNGYLRVKLNERLFYIHRLVAMAFIPNPKCYKEINHKDENKLNNNADNLEWCSHKYNMKFGTRNKMAIDNTKKSVIQYTMSGKYVCSYNSIVEAAGKMSISKGNIVSVLKGNRKSAGGYKWKYNNK